MLLLMNTYSLALPLYFPNSCTVLALLMRPSKLLKIIRSNCFMHNNGQLLDEVEQVCRIFRPGSMLSAEG
jgi:hypothetical protein